MPARRQDRPVVEVKRAGKLLSQPVGKRVLKKMEKWSRTQCARGYEYYPRATEEEKTQSLKIYRVTRF